MPTQVINRPLPFVASALLTLLFVGCFGRTQSLNTSGAGNGGEEGEVSMGGAAGHVLVGHGAGKANAGTSGSAGKAHGGYSLSETGGGPSAGAGGSSGQGGSSSSSAGSDVVGAGGPQGGSTTAGAPNGGVPNGSTAGGSGYSGSAGDSIGPVGSAGGAGYPGCDSATGSGCSGPALCIDVTNDSCHPSIDGVCSGLCATPYETPTCGTADAPACPDGFECVTNTEASFGTGTRAMCVGPGLPECTVQAECRTGFSCREDGDVKRCLPNLVDCSPLAACDLAQAPSCPPGFAAADTGSCNPVCVPTERCACSSDDDCVFPNRCARALGRCFVPSAPSPRCLEPSDQGICEGGVPTFAFIDGSCQATTYCGGNENHFGMFEDCLAECEGRPVEHGCPPGRTMQTVCVACGPTDGCTRYGQLCMQNCETSDDCTTLPGTCSDGVCQAVSCP